MKFQDFIFGLVAGWSQIIVGQPFDFIKVKLQTESNSHSRSLISVAKQIHNQHGFSGFYRGSSSLFFGFGFTIATEFTFYEFAKRILHDLRNKTQNKMKYTNSSLGILDIGIAGALVGLSVSLIYCPIQYAKIRKQTDSNIKTGSLQILFNEIRQNGTKNITSGLTATILRQIIGSFFYYSVYECMVRYFSRNQREKANTLNYVISGGIAGIAYWSVSYPFDVVKTKVQNGESYQTAFNELLRAGYKGFSAVFIRSILVNGVSFAMYQHCRKAYQHFSNNSTN